MLFWRSDANLDIDSGDSFTVCDLTYVVPDQAYFRDTGLYNACKWSCEKEIIDQIFHNKILGKKIPKS